MSEPTERDYLEGLTREQREEHEGTPMTAPPTTGAEETLRDRIAQIIWVQSMAALTGVESDHREEIWPEYRTTMGGWYAFKAADAVIATAVPDAELRAAIRFAGIVLRYVDDGSKAGSEECSEYLNEAFHYAPSPGDDPSYPDHLARIDAWLAQEGRDGNG